MEDKTVMALIVTPFVVLIGGIFLKSAWDEAKKQAEEAANPRIPWTDKNRWE